MSQTYRHPSQSDVPFEELHMFPQHFVWTTTGPFSSYLHPSTILANILPPPQKAEAAGLLFSSSLRPLARSQEEE